MTILFEHGLHVELWGWLADNVEKQKGDWPRWEINGGDVVTRRNYCLACAADPAIVTCQGGQRCPLKWPSTVTTLACTYHKKDKFGLYSKWSLTQDMVERAVLARRIALLPLDPEWKGAVEGGRQVARLKEGFKAASMVICEDPEFPLPNTELEYSIDPVSPLPNTEQEMEHSIAPTAKTIYRIDYGNGYVFKGTLNSDNVKEKGDTING